MPGSRVKKWAWILALVVGITLGAAQPAMSGVPVPYDSTTQFILNSCTYDFFGIPGSSTSVYSVDLNGPIIGSLFVYDLVAGQRMQVVVSSTSSGYSTPYSVQFGGATASGTIAANNLDFRGAAQLVAPVQPGVYSFDIAFNVPAASSTDCDHVVAQSFSVSVKADTAAPILALRAVKAKMRGTAEFTYSVSNELGVTQEVIDVRRGLRGRPVRSWNVEAGPAGDWATVSAKLPRSVKKGSWFWCVTSRDASGNASRPSCNTLKVT